MKLLARRLSLAALGLLALSSTAHAELIYGVTDPVTGALPSLVSFDSATPGTLTTIGAISGLTAGQTLRGIDFRPADGMLYALSNAGTGTAAQLYTVNLGTGALTTVGSGFTLTGNSSDRISLDFNPVVDRLRVVSGNAQSYRVNPNNGALVAQDTSINPLGLYSDIAYTNNVVGATQTTLYAYNFSADSVGTIGGVNGTPSPNGGQYFNTGSSGVVARNGAMGFDISGATGIAYLSLDANNTPISNSELYTVNLGTGAASLIGNFNTPLLDFSVFIPAPGTAVPEPGSVALLVGAGIGGLVLRRRKK